MADSKKRCYQKNKYFYQDNKKRKTQFLEPGAKGFLCTCNYQERNCIREAYNLLNEYADKLYGPENQFEDDAQNDDLEDGSEEPLDLSDMLQRQINDIKTEKPKHKRFQSLATSVTNCIFIQGNVVDPVKLCHSIVEDIATNKVQKTRFLLRLIPVEASCTLKLNDITETAGKLIDKYFSGEATTFCIVFNKRYSNCPRDDIIKQLAELVVAKNANHKVDLQHPNLFIIVEIIKGICLLSVVPDYYKFKKYNLIELCSKTPEKPAINETESETAEALDLSECKEGKEILE